MLLSVAETAQLLELKPAQIYYKLRFSKIDGAIKLFSNWRIDEETVREWHERINEERAGFLPGFDELCGFDAVLKDIREASLQNDKKSCFACLQGRGQPVDDSKSRPHRMVVKPKPRLKTTQLLLFES